MSFKPKTYEEALEKAREKAASTPRKALGHGNSKLARSGALSGQRRPINKVGPRTREWRSVWRFLKPRLEKAGRTGCEFGFMFHDCGGRLDPAHSKKRNKMVGNDIYAVALACENIHRVLDEQMSHEEMEFAVMTAIKLHGGLILPKPERETK